MGGRNRVSTVMLEALSPDPFYLRLGKRFLKSFSAAYRSRSGLTPTK
jgi:hypothetical protein